MAKPKKIFLTICALFIAAVNIALYTWNQSLKALEVSYLVNTPVDRVAFDEQGHVWVSGDGILSVYKDGIPIQVFTKKDSPALGGNLWELEFDNEGRTWIVPQGYERTVDLAVFDGTKWSTIIPKSGSVNNDPLGIYSLAIDSKGRAWVGVEKQGLYIIHEDIWENYTVANSDLLTNTVDSIAFDTQGRAWIGTLGENVKGGLNIFDGESWQTFNSKNSPLPGGVDAIAFDQYGKAWITSGEGVYAFDGENWISYPNLTRLGFFDIDVDGQGRVWAMEAGGESIVVIDGKTQKHFFDPFHMSVARFGGNLESDIDGNIWIPTGNGVVIIQPDSPQPISYAAGILSIVISTNGLIYLTTLLIVIWLCVALKAWRSIGFSLLGFPIYLGWIILWNQELSIFSFQLFNTYFSINPGVVGTIAGLLGGCVDILLARSERNKRTWWGLTGFVIGSGLTSCFMIFINMAQ